MSSIILDNNGFEHLADSGSGFGGASTSGSEADPIYAADKPNIATKAELQEVKNVADTALQPPPGDGKLYAHRNGQPVVIRELFVLTESEFETATGIPEGSIVHII